MVSCILHWAPVQFSSVHCTAESFPQQMQKHQKVPRPRCCSYEPGQGRQSFYPQSTSPPSTTTSSSLPSQTQTLFLLQWLAICDLAVAELYREYSLRELWRRFLYLLSWIRVFVEKPSVTSPCHPFQWRAVNSNFDECIITSSVTPPTFNSLRGNSLIINIFTS